MYALSLLQLSIKDTPIGKPKPLGKDNRMSYAQMQDVTYNWRNVEISPADLITHNTQGKPLAVAQFTNGHRLTANFQRSNLIALDFDGGVKEHSLEGKAVKYMSEQEYIDLLNNPFIQEYAFAVIQSASSKVDRFKARILIRLDRVITDAGDYSAITRWIVEQLPGADHTTDAARFFYGGLPGRAADFIKGDNVLPVAPILAQIELDKAAEKERREKFISQWESGDDLYKEVQEALRFIPAQGDYNEWVAICAAVWDSFPGHDGIALIEGWSPGYSGEVERKFNSFRANYGGKKATIASVFYRAMRHGYERPKPAKPSLQKNESTPKPTSIHLNYEFRQYILEHRKKFKRQDTARVFLAIWEALLNAGIQPLKQLITIEEAARISGYTYHTVYRVFNGLGIYLQSHVLRKGEAFSLAFEFANKSFTGEKGRPTHYYTIPDPRLVAKRFKIKLAEVAPLPAQVWGNIKAYSAFILKPFIQDITTRIPMHKFETAFQFSVGDSLKVLESAGAIEITRDQFKRREVDTGDIEDVIRDVLEAMQPVERRYVNQDVSEEKQAQRAKRRKRGFTGWFEMYTFENGEKVPFNHKGGKSGKPNNRIPISLGAVKRFIDKAHFELVIRTSNLYRRLEAV